MSYYCRHAMVWGRCPECAMGYVPPGPPSRGDTTRSDRCDPAPTVRLNLDRFGLPRDYATYEWVMYRSVVEDNSPARAAFLSRWTTAGSPSRPSVTRTVRA